MSFEERKRNMQLSVPRLSRREERKKKSFEERKRNMHSRFRDEGEKRMRMRFEERGLHILRATARSLPCLNCFAEEWHWQEKEKEEKRKKENEKKMKKKRKEAAPSISSEIGRA